MTIVITPELNNKIPPLSDILEMARRYAACYLAVVPIPRNQKAPRLVGWQRLASTDGRQHQAWFPAGLPSNIGIVTGKISGVFVLDVDVKDGGLETLAVLEQKYGVLPVTPRQDTPTGGKHFVFQLPIGMAIRNSAKKLGAGLDIRGENGVIVATPSVHPNGRQYRWGEGLAPWQVKPANAPDWLLALLIDTDRPASKKKKSVARGAPGAIAEGGRNDALFREASRLRGQGLDQEQVTALLQIFNRKTCTLPLGEDEVAAVALSAMRYNPNERFERNDTGNAERFVRDHGERIRFVSDIGRWRTWDGTRWKDDDGDLTMLGLARETVERMREDAEAATTLEAAKILRNHARASGDHTRLRGMLKVAASLPGVKASSADFDNLPSKLVVANGVVNLENGALLPHNPSLLNTRCIPTAYDPSATAPQFYAAMERVQPNLAVRDFLKVFFGQALHGTRPEQLMIWLHGRGGRNGKSFLADLLLLLLPGYVIETSANSFLSDDKRNPNAPRSDLVRLEGSRLVVGQESDDGRRLDSQRLKQLTGDATFTGRANHQNEREIPITFSLMVLTNPFPNANEADDALWSRFVRVPYDVVIPHQERIPNLYKVVHATEAAGVLAWLVRGAVEYARNGLTIPHVLIEATEGWRRRIGTVEQFMQIFTQRAEINGAQMQLAYLQSKYVRFVQQGYGNPLGRESFRTRLEQLGYTVEDTEQGAVVWSVQPAPHVAMGWASVDRAAA